MRGHDGGRRAHDNQEQARHSLGHYAGCGKNSKEAGERMRAKSESAKGLDFVGY